MMSRFMSEICRQTKYQRSRSCVQLKDALQSARQSTVALILDHEFPELVKSLGIIFGVNDWDSQCECGNKYQKEHEDEVEASQLWGSKVILASLHLY